MQIHIDGIKVCHSTDDLFDHFHKYGRIKSLKIIDTYGYITFESYKDGEKALQEEHNIKGYPLRVQEARTDRVELDTRYDDRYRGRKPYERPMLRRYGRPMPMDEPRYGRPMPVEEPRYGGYYYDMYEPPQPMYNQYRLRCYHCDRYLEHEKMRERNTGHPKDILKIVLMGIPEGVDQNDVKEFVSSHNLQTNFVKITRNGKLAIVEFNTIEEKNEALKLLDKKELNGNIINTREFESSGNNRIATRKRYRDNDFYEDRREDKRFKEENIEDKGGLYQDIGSEKNEE